jgi:hypothetical protein
MSSEQIKTAQILRPQEPKLKLIRRQKCSQIKFETRGKGVPRESATDAQQAA